MNSISCKRWKSYKMISMMQINTNQRRFFKLITWVLVPQILCASAFFSLSMIMSRVLLEMIYQKLSIAIAAGSSVYAVAFSIYGLVYFAQRGALAATKMVSSLIRAVMLKYLLLAGGAYLSLVYLAVDPLPFFIVLFINHLTYVVASSLYMSNYSRK